MKLNKYIDSTLLKAEATEQEIIDFCKEAIKYEFAAVCVHTTRVAIAKKIIGNQNIEISGTVGFPFGNTTISVKILEAQECIKFGATEIDFVINIGLVKDHKWDEVLEELKAIRKAIPNNTLKVIFENCLLSKEEIKKCCELSLLAKIDYVKTSTGYSHQGATVQDIKLMKEIVQDKAFIKAAGGIKTKEEAIRMIENGANRIGTSGGLNIILGKLNQNNY